MLPGSSYAPSGSTRITLSLFGTSPMFRIVRLIGTCHMSISDLMERCSGQEGKLPTYDKLHVLRYPILVTIIDVSMHRRNSTATIVIALDYSDPETNATIALKNLRNLVIDPASTVVADTHSGSLDQSTLDTSFTNISRSLINSIPHIDSFIHFVDNIAKVSKQVNNQHRSTSEPISKAYPLLNTCWQLTVTIYKVSIFERKAACNGDLSVKQLFRLSRSKSNSIGASRS